MTLQEIWNQLAEQGYKSDKGDIHSYIPFYEELFASIRQDAKNILEIGLFKGDSLRMFEKYFSGKVWGIDCSTTPHGGLADLRPMLQSPNMHNIKIIDATNEFDIETNFSGIKFDVIIEDAGHDINQQLELYDIWKNYLTDNGIYIIEDIQNIDRDRKLFENIDPQKTVHIIDRRNIKNRYDDVLVIISDAKPTVIPVVQ